MHFLFSKVRIPLTFRESSSNWRLLPSMERSKKSALKEHHIEIHSRDFMTTIGAAVQPTRLILNDDDR